MNPKTVARHAFLPLALAATYGAGRLTPVSTRADAAASTRTASSVMQAPPMQRRGFRFRIRREKISGYKWWHRRVHPQLLRDLSAAGIRNYSLFLDKDGTVFGYMESADWKRADSAMGKSRANAPWQAIMKDYIVHPADPKQGATTALEEVFHLK